MMRSIAAAVLLTMFGCGSGKAVLDDTTGVETNGQFLKDGRLIADVFTWECLSKGADPYLGTYAHMISLEYAPDALRSLDLPAPGECSYGLDMFPSNAGAGGTNIAGIESQPEWESESYDGELELTAAGFWFDDVLGNEHLCAEATERLEGGTKLFDAGVLSGISTPQPADIPNLEYDGFDTVIDFGSDIDISWEEHDWEQVWVQLRRESGNDVVESVTCNVTNGTSFTVDADVWAMLDSSLNVEKNNLYVAFQRAETVQTTDDQLIDVFTRVIDIAVIID
jgi:hypothetical protein